MAYPAEHFIYISALGLLDPLLSHTYTTNTDLIPSAYLPSMSPILTFATQEKYEKCRPNEFSVDLHLKSDSTVTEGLDSYQRVVSVWLQTSNEALLACKSACQILSIVNQFPPDRVSQSNQTIVRQSVEAIKECGNIRLVEDLTFDDLAVSATSGSGKTADFDPHIQFLLEEGLPAEWNKARLMIHTAHRSIEAARRFKVSLANVLRNEGVQKALRGDLRTTDLATDVTMPLRMEHEASGISQASIMGAYLILSIADSIGEIPSDSM